MPRALPPLRLLTAFEARVRTGSAQAAAGELNVTQPAISQSLRQLEEHLGARLLDRGRRPAELTEAGRILKDAVTEGLDRIAGAVDRIRATERAGAAAVTVACSVGVATYWLMPRLASFCSDRPEVAVNVVTTPLGAPDLAHGVDLAIRYGHGRWRDGAVSKLFNEEVRPVCSPDLLERAGGRIDLARAPLLHVRTQEESWLSWPVYLRRAGLPPNGGPGRSFTNYVQAIQAALAGQGVLLGWVSLSAGLVAEGRLIPVGAPSLRPPDAFYLVRRRNAQGAAAAFADRLLAGCGRAAGDEAVAAPSGDPG